MESEVDEVKALSEKLEIINLQLARKKTMRRKIIRWLLAASCVMIAVIFAALLFCGSPYLSWNLHDPETAVVGVVFHAFEWLFVRTAPIILAVAVIGIVFTRKKE